MSETWLTRHEWCTRQSWRSPTGMSFWPSGRMTTGPRLIVLHSTETVGFPGYNNGAAAPHFTIDLVTGETRQHVPLNWGSRCLAVSTGGVTDRTVNISGTIQIETIGAVTPGYPRTYGHYDLVHAFPTDTRAQAHLARLLRAIHDATGIPLQPAPGLRWVSHPASYGVHAPQRLGSAAFRAIRGVCGHQHAPANSHGDGLYGRSVDGRPVDLEATLAIARSAGTPGRDGDVFFEGADGPDVHQWQTDLAALGYDLVGVGLFGPKTTAATRAFQSDHGITVDGRVGPVSRTTMENTMRKLDDLARQIEALDRKIGAVHDEQRKTTPKTIVDALMSRVLYGLPFHWWVRRGGILDPDHRHFPADPGSPADKELRAEAAESGYTTVYGPDGAAVLLELDPETDRFKIKED